MLFILGALLVISVISAALLGPKKAVLLVAVLAFIGAVVAAQHVSGAGIVLLLAYGGGFGLVAGALGIAIGALFRKR